MMINACSPIICLYPFMPNSMSRVPKSPPKSVRREILRDSIKEAASTLFIQRGFQGTSLVDIAEVMGVTRTAIYYYFRNKDAILSELTSEITEMAAKLAEEVVTEEVDPVTTLQKLVARHARLILTHPLQFRVVERNEEQLSPPLRKKAQAARRLVLDLFATAVDAGVQSGHFRNVNPKVSAFAILGMCNWGAWWFTPAGGVSLDEVVDMIVDFAMHSVLRVETRRLRDGSVAEAMRQIKEDLAVLERRLSGLPVTE